MPAPLTSLAALASPELPHRPLLLVPVGSLEQHGPHLPLDTDTVIAQAVADRTAAQSGSLVAPALGYGSSGEHQDFPGTVSIGAVALAAVLVELVRSASAWAGRVVFINGHGGNTTVLAAVTTQLRHEGHDVEWVACRHPGGDLHAGRTETSLLLHLRPEAVRLDRFEAGNTAPLRDMLDRMRSHGVAAVSANGVLGNPTGATAKEGREILTTMTQAVLDEL